MLQPQTSLRDPARADDKRGADTSDQHNEDPKESMDLCPRDIPMLLICWINDPIPHFATIEKAAFSPEMRQKFPREPPGCRMSSCHSSCDSP